MHIRFASLPHRTLVLAGLAGATAEVAWVGVYCLSTPLQGIEVLRQIAASILPDASAPWAAAFGLAAHYALAILIAYAYGLFVWRGERRNHSTLADALKALTAIWAFNFFVLLPVINPAFVDLMPLPVTFASKLLFALAMAGMLDSAPGVEVGETAARIDVPRAGATTNRA